MNSPRLRIRLLCLSLLLLPLACGTTSNWGVEVGNPKLGGETVTINPKDHEESYVISFAEDGSAEVSKVANGNFETIAGTVTTEGNFVQVTAQFSQGPKFDAMIELGENDEILGVTLTLDGVVVPTQVTVEPKPVSLQGTWSDDALLAVATLCRRVSECQPAVPVAECEADLVLVPGLAQSFGGTPGQSLDEMADSLENGATLVDPAALEECLAAIDILPCIQVDRAHDPDDPHDYSQAHRLVPKPSCPQAFQGNL